MTAAGTFLYEARERYPGNALVEELYQRNQELSLDEDEGRVTREMLLERISEVDSVLRRDEEGLE